MGDFGIKLTQSGHDVQGAGDQELLFSSSWPVLPVVYNGKFTGLTSDNPLVLLTHNLGFVPAFMAYTPGSTYTVGGANVSADKKNIYWSPGGGGQPPFAVSIAIKVFNIDIEKNFLAPQIRTSTSAQAHGDENFGVKFSKETKDVYSNDLRDFLIHSSTRGPMIHAVANGLGNAPGSIGNTMNFNYAHDLPYNPLFLTYMQSSSLTSYFLVSTFAATQTSGNNISIVGMPAGSRASIVVFKDPFQISDNIIKVS